MTKSFYERGCCSIKTLICDIDDETCDLLDTLAKEDAMLLAPEESVLADVNEDSVDADDTLCITFQLFNSPYHAQDLANPVPF